MLLLLHSALLEASLENFPFMMGNRESRSLRQGLATDGSMMIMYVIDAV